MAKAKKDKANENVPEGNEGTILDPSYDAAPDGSSHGERLAAMKGLLVEIELEKDAKVDIDGVTEEYEKGSVLEVPEWTAVEMIRHGIAKANKGDPTYGERKPLKATKKARK